MTMGLPLVSHLELKALAEEVSHEYYTNLGLNLGLYDPKLRNILRDNGSQERATYDMLCCWLGETRECERRPRLVEALDGSRLRHLADKIEQGAYCPRILNNDIRQDATDEQIDQCKKDLMEEYAIAWCQVQTKPLDPDTLLALNLIYTNLVLLGEDPKSKSKPLNYEDILSNKINDVFLRRVLVQGEAGVGKTTFLSKIINDWIEGTHFKEFKLVLPVRLREVKDGKTVGEIIKQNYLPDNEVTAMQLDNYIKKNQEKVLILLDGYDELAELSASSILKILKCLEYKKCSVIITSRPWKANQIRHDIELRKRYAFVEIKGFTRENVNKFVSRFFNNVGKAPESAESLVKFMEKGSLIAENMSPYPIFCAMLCHLWEEEDRREAVQKLKTFSQLFQEIIQFLKDRYFAKRCKNLSLRSCQEKKMDLKRDLEKNFLQLAEVAFRGLMKNDMVFPEDTFSQQVLRCGYDVGLLSNDRKCLGKSERKRPCLMGNVFFPHKLFQEFLAGLHLAEQEKTNPLEYKDLLNTILSKNRDEMKFLLFFAAAQEEKVALDITSGLVNKLEQSSVRSTVCVDKTPHKLIVDVVFESFSEDVAKVVETRFPSLSRVKELKVDDAMSAHTVAGYFFTFQNLRSAVFLERQYGYNLSSDLADKVCTLNSLQKVHLDKASFHEVFYEIFAAEAKNSRVKSFTLKGIPIKCPSSSCHLAKGLCDMPLLESLMLHHVTFEAEFYSTLMKLAHRAKIKELKELHLADLNLESEAVTSGNLAKAVCSMPSLKKLILSDLTVLHDEFYTNLAAKASSTQIEVIRLSDLELTGKPSHDLAICLNTMPCLYSLAVVKGTELHPRFFSICSTLTQENGQDENQSKRDQNGFTLTLDDKTINAWCKHKPVPFQPRLATFVYQCSKTVDAKTLQKASLPELAELQVQAALPNRDPELQDVDGFSKAVTSSFPGLQRLVLTHISLGNHRSMVIIKQLKDHPSLQSIRFIECRTDNGMDALCQPGGKILVSMEHGMREKM
ncbi:NLR family CARD domain-containing protein 4-like [Lytechinus pictus]|uniref:NLR family CARD domain-containing protein 4-like n=1 Tax=Lytechinus pictus TaxID=7653 RepID=UPI0030BA157D